MTDEKNRKQEEQASRLKVEELPKSERELTADEQRKIRGGVIRSVGNRDGGDTGGGTSGGSH